MIFESRRLVYISVMNDEPNIQEAKIRLISLHEAAEMLGLSHSYLRALASKGRLRAQKFGTSWVTTPKNVENYIKNHHHLGALTIEMAQRPFHLKYTAVCQQ